MKKSYFISFLSLEAEDDDDDDGGSFKDVEAIAEVRAARDFGGLAVVDGTVTAAAEDTFAADFVTDLIVRCSMGIS